MAEIGKGLPPLDWLRMFEAAGRLGGFSAAAREYGLSQAAVSQRIGNLEAWLGRSLFVREPRGVRLTLDGESYLPLVQDSLQALERDTESLFGKAPSELRLAGMHSHLNALVFPRLAMFRGLYPDVRLKLDSLGQRAGFDDQKTWLQIRYGQGNWPGREARLLHSEQLVPMTAPGTAWGAALIALRGERLGWGEWLTRFNRADPDQDWLSVDSMEHALSLAAQGLGIALGSVPMAAQLLDEQKLYRLDLPSVTPGDGYWLTWPRERLTSRKQRKMVIDLAAVLAGTPSDPDQGLKAI